jgi:hypothetical protein
MIETGIERAKIQLNKAVENIRNEYGMPYFILEGIIKGVLADVREKEKRGILEESEKKISELRWELEKAKAAAKKVFNGESDQVSESETGQQGGHPEE